MLKRIAPPEMEIFELARVDLTALGFAFALSLLTGVVFGVAARLAAHPRKPLRRPCRIPAAAPPADATSF